MSNLLDNPQFLADLKSDLSSRAVADRWPVSKSTVNKYRAALSAKDGLPTAEKISAIKAEGRYRFEDDGVNVRLDTRATTVAQTHADVEQSFRDEGLDPADFDLTIRRSKWENGAVEDDGELRVLHACSVTAKRRPVAESTLEDVDLPALYAAARTATPAPQKQATGRATVVVWSDPQIGKTGRRGGTKELLERSQIIRHKLDALLTERNPERVLLADGGDGIEGFESGGNPMFTNDLSLPGQLDLYGTELFEFINLAHKHAPVTVMGVSSNHSAWRNGKQNLGIPADDLGLFMHKQTAKVTKAAGMSVDWVAPEPYDESVAFEFAGTTVGLVHGNQFAPGQAVQWWEKQTFGAGACVRADVLVHGHYHSFSANVAGRNPVSGRQRWCFGAPTLDNGSDWFRQTAGRDSDPGLLVFDVTADGFDIASLVIL